MYRKVCEVYVYMYLHDEEVRVVHVELHGAEQVLHARGSGVAAINEILVSPANHHLNTPNTQNT